MPISPKLDTVPTALSVPPTPVRWSDLFRGDAAAPFLALFGGVAMHAVYLFITVTTLPTIVSEIGGLAYYAWVTTCFTVGSILASAAAPVISARKGVQATFLASLALFLLGSICSAFAPSMALLIVGRTLQGLGGGALPALAYANIQNALPPDLRPRAIAAVSGVWGIAALTGPLVGGFFAQFQEWRGVFLLPVPIVAVLVTIVLRRPLRGDVRHDRQTPSVGRLLLLSVAILAVAAGSVPGTLAASATGIGLGAIALAWMLRLDHASEAPLLPTQAYDPRLPLGAVTLAMGGLTFALSAAGFVPYVLQRAQGVSALTAGYVEAVVTITWTISALLTAHMAGAGARRLMTWSPIVAVLGTAGVALGFVTGELWHVVFGMCLIGTGIGIGWAHMADALVTNARTRQKGLAAAFINTNQLIAMAFGSSLAGALLNVQGFASSHAPGDVARCGVVLFVGFTLAPLAGAVIIGRFRAS